MAIDLQKFKKETPTGKIDLSKFKKQEDTTKPQQREFKGPFGGFKKFGYSSGGELGAAGLGAASTVFRIAQKVGNVLGKVAPNAPGANPDFGPAIEKTDAAREKIKAEVNAQKGFVSGAGKVVGSVVPYLIGPGELSAAKGLAQEGLAKMLPKFLMKRSAGRFAARTIANAAVEGPVNYGIAKATGEDDKTAKGIGIGAAVIPGALEGVTKGLGKVFNSLGTNLLKNYLRPIKSELSFGKDPVGAVNKYGIVANSAEDYVEKINKAKGEVGKGIDDVVTKEVPNVETTSVVNITNKGGQLIDEANQVSNTYPARVGRLKGVATDIENFAKGLAENGKLNIKQLWELKKFIGKLKAKWNEEEASAVNKYISKMYGATKEQIELLMQREGVAPEVIEKYKALSEDYGSLVGAESAANRAKLRGLKGFNPFTLSRAKIGAALIGGFFSKSPEGAGIAAIIETALEHPAVLTRLAPILAKTPIETIQLWAKDAPWITKLIDRVKTSHEYDMVRERVKGKNVTKEDLEFLADGFKKLPGEINEGLSKSKVVGPAYKKVKQFIKKPKMGMSVEDISKKPLRITSPEDIQNSASLSDDRHVFHSTVYDNLHEIKSKGLLPSKPMHDSSGRGIYFSLHPEEGLGIIMKSPVKKDSAILRITTDGEDEYWGHKNQMPYLDESEQESIYYKKKIDPRDIEVWTGKNWIPLKEANI